MRPLGRWAGVAAIALAGALLPGAAFADDAQADLEHIFYSAQQDGESSGNQTVATSGAPAYDYGPTCGLGGRAVCYEGSPCVDDGVEGLSYDVFLAGEKVGEVCVTEQEAVEQEQVTPGRVLRAFRSLEWPQSDLVIQPPDGQTLVNLPTNFFTDNTSATRQTARLLGQEVLIEAVPATYTWRFGDGASQATASPGTAFPALEITHQYADVGTFAPSVDTTYTGRYRLNGGPWIAIPESLTVAGASQDLEAIPARPTLVDY